MAAQQGVGLLSKRRVGSGPFDCAGASGNRAHLKKKKGIEKQKHNNGKQEPNGACFFQNQQADGILAGKDSICL
jgi:hypothetical protein